MRVRRQVDTYGHLFPDSDEKDAGRHQQRDDDPWWNFCGQFEAI